MSEFWIILWFQLFRIKFHIMRDISVSKEKYMRYFTIFHTSMFWHIFLAKAFDRSGLGDQFQRFPHWVLRVGAGTFMDFTNEDTQKERKKLLNDPSKPNFKMNEIVSVLIV